MWKKYELIEFTTDPEQLDFEPVDSTKNRHAYMGYLDLTAVERNILGYRAQTVQDLVFRPYEALGFDLGYHNLDLYRYDFNTVRYYDNEAPLTRLSYVLGFNEEQAFQVVHSQKIKQRFNFVVDFQRLGSRGNLGVDRSRREFFRQGATSKQLFTELWYRSLNGKYNVAFAYLNNDFEINEHGGVKEADRLELIEEFDADRNLMTTNYDNASRGQFDQHLRFRQSIDFGSYYPFALNDSVNIQKLDPKLRIYHTSEYIDEGASYRDLRIDSSNYDTIVYNPFFTADTLSVQRWVHRAGANFLLGKNDFSKYTGQIKAGLKYESIYLQQESDYLYIFPSAEVGAISSRNIGEYFDNTLFESRFDLRKKDLVGLDLRGEFNLGLRGISEGDLQYRASLGYELEVGGLRVWSAYSNRRPSQVFFRNASNHSPYDRTSLPNTEVNRVGASLSFKRQPIKVSVENTNINNWLIFQSDGRPTVVDEANILNLNVLSQFKFGAWHLDANVHLQNPSKSVLGLPKFLGMAAVYYRRPLFENATLMTFGINARYWSEYKTLKYTPFLGQFVEDGTELETYPILDAFVNFQINRVSAYVRTEHLSQGLGGNVYFPTAYISGADRNVRFGFTWLFYD